MCKFDSSSHSSLKSHHFLYNDCQGKKKTWSLPAVDPNGCLAAAFRMSASFCQKSRAFWCCIHLVLLFNSHSLFSVPTSCLHTKHLKACLLRVYRLCPAGQEVYFLELLFFKKEDLFQVDLQIIRTFHPQMGLSFIFREILHPNP